jgi:hypothetical protein
MAGKISGKSIKWYDVSLRWEGTPIDVIQTDHKGDMTVC